jgi:hypothetical protein
MNLAILKPQSLTRFSLQKDLGFECLNNTESFHTLSALQFDTKLSSPYAAMFKRASAAYIVRCVKRLHCVSGRFPYLGGTSASAQTAYGMVANRANKSQLAKPIEHGDVVDSLPLRIHTRRCCCS